MAAQAIQLEAVFAVERNGSLVASRADVLSELDLVWKKDYGARFSAALWWDPAYGSLDNSNSVTANTLVNGLPVAGALCCFVSSPRLQGDPDPVRRATVGVPLQLLDGTLRERPRESEL